MIGFNFKIDARRASKKSKPSAKACLSVFSWENEFSECKNLCIMFPLEGELRAFGGAFQKLQRWRKIKCSFKLGSFK
ncbi:hypothetical protein A3L14_03685 [Thermococcus thioreducens]|uniref:Uncharacterized protein n=1 Tax=Thermococcus thioreducens TaxID=277988 RepID=A0A0Q2MSM5_9EURY|nr:hypothetical protein A3L14_03685 [Thermococcus thioreducens]KQH82743.1 hypothetical protein AMR53_03880 [Thermococcus thioreducens]